jgi:hypothetical protein
MQRKAKSARALAFSGVLVTVVAVLLGGGQTTAQAGPPQEAVLDWNLNALDALFNSPTAVAPTRPGGGQSPTVAQQHLAMVHGAVYDAVNMIDGGHEPYLDGLPSAPASASMPAAVATAAHHVLVGLGIAPVPALPAATQTWLNTAYADSLVAIPNGQAKTDGIAAGTAAASAMLAERMGDGRFVPFSFTCGDDPGEWRPTASVPPGGPPPLTCAQPGVSDPFAWIAKVKPWTLDSASQFRTKGPVDLGSQLYVKEYNEVKRLGGNGTTTPHERTAEQQEVAQLFTVNPMPMYSSMLRGLAKSEGLTLVEQARLFALVNIATADAQINTWDDKVFFSNWRPVTAIRLGDSDGNPKTVGDASWTPLNPSPPYPDQSSGYNCVTGAVMHTAKSFFNGNKMEFDLTGTVTVGFATPTVITRPYTHFTDVLRDTIDARVWNGIHFRSSDEGGAKIGRNVAHWVEQNYLRPVHGKGKGK